MSVPFGRLCNQIEIRTRGRTKVEEKNKKNVVPKGDHYCNYNFKTTRHPPLFRSCPMQILSLICDFQDDGLFFFCFDFFLEMVKGWILTFFYIL